LAEVLADFPRVVIVEDDHFTGVASVRPGSLSSDARLAERTLYARSHSKSIAPDLRMTIVAARGRLFGLLRDARLSNGGWAPRIGQRALAQALLDPALDQAFAAARVAYAERRAAAIESIQAALPQAMVIRPTDGLNVWVTLPDGSDAQAVTEHAAHLGVLCPAASRSTASRPARCGAAERRPRRRSRAHAAAGQLLAGRRSTADDVPLSLPV